MLRKAEAEQGVNLEELKARVNITLMHATEVALAAEIIRFQVRVCACLCTCGACGACVCVCAFVCGLNVCVRALDWMCRMCVCVCAPPSPRRRCWWT